MALSWSSTYTLVSLIFIGIPPLSRSRGCLASSHSTRRSLVHPLEQILEVVEAALPEPGHPAGPVDQRGKRAELRAVVRLAAFVPVAHQAGPLQDAEMLRDGRLRHPGPGRESPDR